MNRLLYMPSLVLEKKQGSLVEAKFDDQGLLTGYASVKNNTDSYGDIIVDGAYKNLEVLLKKGWSGFNHSMEPVGIVTKAVEDSKGLYVEIKFHSTQYAQDCRTIMMERRDAGLDLGMSIMYRTLKSTDSQDGDNWSRKLEEIEVIEAGFVMLPANDAATVTSVKDGSGTTLDEQVADVLERTSDLTKRLNDLRELRGKLSDERKADVQALAEKVNDFALSVSGSEGDDQPVMANEEEVAKLLASLNL